MSTLYESAEIILFDVCDYLSKDCGFDHTVEPQGKSLHELAYRAMDHRSTTNAMHLALWETFSHLVKPDDVTQLTPFQHAINNGNQRLLLALLVKLCSHLLPREDNKRKPISGARRTRKEALPPKPAPAPLPPKPVPAQSVVPAVTAAKVDEDTTTSHLVGKKRGRYAKKQCKGAEDCNKGANRECYHNMCLAHCRAAQASSGKLCTTSSHRRDTPAQPSTPSPSAEPPKKKPRTIAMSDEEGEEKEKKPLPFGASVFLDLEAEDGPSEDEESEESEEEEEEEEEQEESESEDDEDENRQCCHRDGNDVQCKEQFSKACYYFRCYDHCYAFQATKEHLQGECDIHI